MKKNNLTSAYVDSFLQIELLKYPNLVLATDKDSNRQMFEARNYGFVNFPAKNGESIREYFSHEVRNDDTDLSFGYALAKLKEPKLKLPNELNYLIYTCVYPGFYDAMKDKKSQPENFLDNNFPAIEGVDVLGKIDTQQLKNLIQGKVVIICHLGEPFMFNKMDISYKHRVPFDSSLFNRLPLATGVLIHANAVQMYLKNHRMTNLYGYKHEVITSFILIIFLIIFSYFHHNYYLGKLINLLIIFAVTIPIVYFFAVTLMDLGFRFKLWGLFFQIVFLLEFIEIVDGFKQWYNKKKQINHENK